MKRDNIDKSSAKYVLVFFAVFSLLCFIFMINSLQDANLKEDELLKYMGKVTKLYTRTSTYKDYDNIERLRNELIFQIDQKQITLNDQSYFSKIKRNIFIGDTITIKTYKGEIVSILKNKRDILASDYFYDIRDSQTVVSIGGFFASLILIIFIFLLRKNIVKTYDSKLLTNSDEF